MTIQPNLERPHPVGSGIQKLYRFDNGLGASVVRFAVGPFGGSYGVASGLWELAVLRFHGDDITNDYHLAYDTPITDDVLGHLGDEEVEAILALIRVLPGDTVRVDSALGETTALTSGEESAR